MLADMQAFLHKRQQEDEILREEIDDISEAVNRCGQGHYDAVKHYDFECRKR